MWAAHNLTTHNVHSAYVNTLNDGKKKKPHMAGQNWKNWFEYISDLLELRCCHCQSGSRLWTLPLLLGDNGTASSLPFFTPGELVTNTFSFNLMLISRRLRGMIYKIFTLKELTFKWVSKLFQENFSSYVPSVSSGVVFSSYTKCGVHHLSTPGHSFQDSWSLLAVSA